MPLSLNNSSLNNSSRYHYIIAGTGCAGLSLLVHLLQNNSLRDKKILLVDRQQKDKNDRTWCFWEKGTGPFEKIVSNSWDQMWYRSPTLSRQFPLAPYRYKLIRGIDLYQYAFELAATALNVEHRISAIDETGEDAQGAFVRIGDERVYADYVFNSILFENPVMGKGEYSLLQHFKGWFIKSESPCFDPGTATLMDFRISQNRGTTFVYVMPFSSHEALVEYTLFTDALLSDEEYDEGLRSYVSEQLKIDKYTVTDTETGVIPMTNHRFSLGKGRVINMGTAGGRTKGSTGYTFQFIQKQSARIVEALEHGKNPLATFTGRDKRFEFYDSVLLNILHHNTLTGEEIFTRLFARNDPRDVLRFLDKDSSLWNDLKLVFTLPTLPFLKAAITQLS